MWKQPSFITNALSNKENLIHSDHLNMSMPY